MPDTPPELAAAAKRIAALEADVANLRRGMVQQLTVTGRLVQQALALDARHFAGRFLAGRQPNPQEELGIAADILGAAASELDKRAGGAPVAGSAMTEVLRAELVAREGELAELRRQSVALQDEHAAILAGMQTRVEQAEERAAAAEVAAQNAGGNEDDRRSDRAEALGLCSELLRTLQASPAGGDDVQITLQVLQDSLKDGGEMGTVCSAAETAVVSWAEALLKELDERKAAAAGLDALRATAGEWQKQATQLKAELDKARADSAKAIADARSTTERSGIIEREITKLQSERETLVRDVERLQVELGEQRRAAHEANMARTRDREDTEAYRSKAKDEASQIVAQAQADSEVARKAAAQALAERDQLQGRLNNAQERIDRLDAERERASAELAALRAERDAGQTQAGQTQQQLATVQAERDRAVAEAAALRKDLSTVRAESEAVSARERSSAERATTLQSERDKLVAERERALAEVGTLKRDIELIRGERDVLQGKVAAGAKSGEALSLERDRAVGERERAEIEISQLRKELEAARAANERVAGERDAMRSRITAADGTAEAAMRERDQARNQMANAAAERDRFRAALESTQEERSALMRSKDDQASQLTLRLTESSRQLGEMKQVHARLASENDRLSAELDMVRKVAERGKTDAAEMARRAEAMALDRRRVEEAETRATAAENRSAEIERRAQAAIEGRDGQLRMALGEAKRLVDDLAASKAAIEAERRRFADVIALLKEAKSKVEDAKRQTATFDAVQAELARLKSAPTPVPAPQA